MDSSKPDTHLLDELLGIDPRAFDDDERTLVLPRSDPPPADPATARLPPVQPAQLSVPAVSSSLNSDEEGDLSPTAALPRFASSSDPVASSLANATTQAAASPSAQVAAHELSSVPSIPAAAPLSSPALIPGGADDPFIGELVDGRYRVLRLLGVGGIGLVYLCRHEALEKPVALKMLRPEYVLHEDLNARFLNEARAASAIKSPRIVDTLDVGTLPSGAPYFVMEYVEGETLAALLDRDGRVDLQTALDIARQLAEGLDAAHAAGVVHRDLKPENVFLARTAEGLFAKIFDFGIAKVARARKRLTYAGAVFGTPHYMSPEQARGEEVDARSDLYALGVMLFEMVTGRVPFDGEDPLAVMSQHVDRVPPLMSSITATALPADLEAIVARCLAKDPRDRYASGAELLRDLESLPPMQADPAPVASSVEAPLPSAPTRLPSLQSRPETLHAHVVPAAPKSRGRSRWFVAGGVLLAAAAGLAFFVRHSASEQSASEKAAAQLAANAATGAKPTEAKADRVGVAARPSREVHFVLSPIDSHVFRGDEDLGPMPVSIQVEEGSPVTLTVRRKGYTTRKLVVDGSETRVVVGLVRAEQPQSNLSKAPAVIRRKF
ncbi:MAG: protein kinase domain-containing protein [Myxococcota bacterium]